MHLIYEKVWLMTKKVDLMALVLLKQKVTIQGTDREVHSLAYASFAYLLASLLAPPTMCSCICMLLLVA